LFPTQRFRTAAPTATERSCNAPGHCSCYCWSHRTLPDATSFTQGATEHCCNASGATLNVHVA
jgi:hypothetical protein